MVDGDGLHGPGEVDAEPMCQGTFLSLFALHSRCPDKPRSVSPQASPNEYIAQNLFSSGHYLTGGWPSQ